MRGPNRTFFYFPERVHRSVWGCAARTQRSENFRRSLERQAQAGSEIDLRLALSAGTLISTV
eukprot:COSAG01_NODE_1248_length_11071_cov_30.622676_5_plen_62_part_00